MQPIQLPRPRANLFHRNLQAKWKTALDALVTRVTVTAVTSTTVTVTQWDGTTLGTVAKVKNTTVSVGDTGYLINTTGDPSHPGWLFIGAEGADVASADFRPLVMPPGFRDGSSTGTYTDSAGTGVVINSIQSVQSGLDSSRTYIAFCFVTMRLGASTGAPLQQAGVRLGSDAGATVTKGTGHSAGTSYEWAFAAASRQFTGLTSFQANGVAFANVTTAQNIAGGSIHGFIFPR